MALIARNGQGIGTSPFSKWAANVERMVEGNANECNRINSLIENLYEKMDEHSGMFLNNEGSGLYRLQSVFNHSCEPNAEVQFPHNDNTLVVKAKHDIQPGEEIFNCYLDECIQSRSRHTRIKFIREHYLFTCKCTKCQRQINDPDVTSEEEESESDSDMTCDSQ